jgi:hypothetical protein
LAPKLQVLYFQAAVLSYLIFSLLRWIFFGQLRAAEVEHAQERVWHAIMETCLAFSELFNGIFMFKMVFSRLPRRLLAQVRHPVRRALLRQGIPLAGRGPRGLHGLAYK